MIKVSIVGGTGYAGVELLRLLSGHPGVRLHTVTSRAEAGMPIAQAYPSLRGHIDLAFADPERADLQRAEVVFFATPNGVAMQQARSLLQAGVKVLDLAADFRIKDVALWEKWYGMKHACPELVEEAVYGLPEVHRDRIRDARLVAVPGCYPTAVQLGLLPLVESRAIDLDHIVADAKSGVSGAGRKSETHLLLSEAADNLKAYGVPGHRHLPEIAQGLAQAAGREVGLTFVPHLIPMIRGIHATLYGRLTREIDLQELFETRYAKEPFVDVLPPDSHPDTRSVRGANQCRLALHRPQGRDVAVVLSVIDNLVKGAAGQAVQNLNIMLGIPETTGLAQPALVP